ncbi:hypothetical protein GDO86_010502 [Hymenochirus boettgeri]|uniref:Uncharacterized protein n=1 Tax=Hymenochirus boettgeri TaxID=247094 RepID=A0A8T2JKR0_9PIPI|nr:hypothetical protein GDO86_010502 [Hymenochirus boettgeri]
MRPGPRASDEGAEWSFYPTSGKPFTYHFGKRCLFSGTHLGNQTSLDVQTLQTVCGKKKTVFDPRNGIPIAKPGDNPFHIPEYSPSFHKFGSTRPVMNFREPYRVKADTFIPLQKIPLKPGIPYNLKEKQQIREEERKEVKQLTTWKPSQRSFGVDVPSNGQRTKVD